MLPVAFPYPFYEGGTVSSVVPGLLPVAIGGRAYAIDTTNPAWRRLSIQALRGQVDQSERPGEQSLNPEDLWRRSIESWHRGAGQRLQDAAGKSAERFWRSSGVDPWTEGRLTLLPEVAIRRLSANTNLQLAVAGSRCYLIDGNDLVFTTNIDSPTWTTVTGTGMTAPKSITSNGYTVWVATASNIFYTNTSLGTYAAAMAVPTPADWVGYAKGRLLGASGNTLFEVRGTPGTHTTTVLATSTNSNWRWVGLADLPSALFVAGYSGDKSTIYRLWLMNEDDTELSPPVAVADMPDSEIVTALYGYLGVMLIGTTKGVRVAAINASGELAVGALFRTGGPVNCFEGQDRFVWFGYRDENGTETGLGRLDLSTFNENLVPASAPDVTVSGSGTTLSAATFGQDRRLFTISGLGLLATTDVPRASGWIESGDVSYGIVDRKVAAFLDVRNESGGGSYAAELSVDGGPYAPIGGTVQASAAASIRLPVGMRVGETFRVRFTLTRGAANETPVLSRWTLRAHPKAARRSKWFLPLLLYREVQTAGRPVRYDIDDELFYLLSLWESGEVVLLQVGNMAATVVLEDFEWQPRRMLRDPDWVEEGTFVAVCKEV